MFTVDPLSRGGAKLPFGSVLDSVREVDVTVLRMDDGKVNAQSPRFAEHFVPTFRQAAAGGGAVVLAGNARAFSAGLDVEAVLSLPERELASMMRGLMLNIAALLSSPRPVVAVVEGPALGLGAVLALSCHARVAGPRAHMGIPVIAAGLPAPEPIARLASARLNPAALTRALVLGESWRGAACVDVGWCDAYAEDALARGVELAGALDAAPPGPYEDVRRALWQEHARAFEAYANGNAETWAAQAKSEETQARVRAARDARREKK